MASNTTKPEGASPTYMVSPLVTPWLGSSPGREMPTQSNFVCKGHVWNSTTMRGGDTAAVARAASWLKVANVMEAGMGDASKEGPRTSNGSDRANSTSS